jgi:hypothetical protein
VQQGFLFGRRFGDPTQADHASIRGGQYDVGALQGVFLLWSVSMSSLCAIPGSLRRTSMVVEFEAYGLKVRSWTTSGSPTSG